jgi:hypothetical protein
MLRCGRSTTRHANEKLHPETKRGVAGGKASGRKRANKSQDESCSPAFVADTAAKTGKARATVARDATRW